ncbi:GSU2403 family nucleotidyltransferase fold protein [Shinella sp. BYT-45]|uniref:nucleotidyltransferase family protein n=1 Tax=Shinella sp. BYT-45 TaxID=3377377 RepID=UPI00397F8ADD
MKPIDIAYQTLFSELTQRCFDGAFVSDFPPEGRFVPVTVNDRAYWYFDTPDGAGGKKRSYVGPAEDPEISGRVERFKDLKADIKARHKLVSTLVREAYLPQPNAIAGDVVEALANAGLFRLRTVLVGTTAFQAYPGLLGVRFDKASLQTGDADFAQFHSVSAAVEDSIPPVLQVIRSVDKSFREIPHRNGSTQATQFRAKSGFMVEFLTPNRGSDENEEQPARMPALGGAAATPLRFLDFLIHQPVRSVLLHKAGVPVLVPAPERFTVHKLIVASRRLIDGSSLEKSEKDKRQASALVEALLHLRRHVELTIAYSDAWQRGKAWREALGRSLASLTPHDRERLQEGLFEGLKHIGDAPATVGL